MQIIHSRSTLGGGAREDQEAPTGMQGHARRLRAIRGEHGRVHGGAGTEIFAEAGEAAGRKVGEGVQ